MEDGGVTTQFVPAAPGWLALFEYEEEGETLIHAEPVIAWCLGVGNDTGHHLAFGKAVVGANPWIDKAEAEDAAHYFALVREEQLEPEFREELARNAVRTRESLMAQAHATEADRREGHASWVRNRHRHRAHGADLA